MRAVIDVFLSFLQLGCYSFGGPVAHLSYFHTAFVERKQWLTEDEYAQLIALSQFLPGPGSSQVGFGIGLHRAGLLGGCAAFLGFTLPSFILLYALAITTGHDFTDFADALALMAVVVVIHATINMGQKFCQSRLHQGLALLTAASVLFLPNLLTQLGALALAAIIGIAAQQRTPQNKIIATTPSVTHWPRWPLALLVIGILVSMLPTQASVFLEPWHSIFQGFFQTGGMVFGGGHVVLPLLQHTVASNMSESDFLLGYSAAQAIPGPMFSLSAFLGAKMTAPEYSLMGAALATFSIFLPGFLLMIALKNGWQTLAQKPSVSGATQAINASVVGLLLAALYHPVFTHAVHNTHDIAWVALGVFALRVLKLPVIFLVFCFLLKGFLNS